MQHLVASAGTSALGAFLSPGGARGRLSVLIYHRILAVPDPLLAGEVDAQAFAGQMALISHHFNVLPLAEAIECLARGALPPRAVCVTFDDGYADNHDVALPILRQLGVPATFFIASGYLDGGRMWNDTVIEAVRAAQGPILDLSVLGLGTYRMDSNADRCAGMNALLKRVKYEPPASRDEIAGRIAAAVGGVNPGSPMMTRRQVRALHDAGMEIGGHTVTHAILARLTPAEAEKEMADGKAELEAIVGGPVTLFAYPNGKPIEDFGPEHVALARRVGFRAAMTTSWGAARTGSDLFQLPRFTPWDRRPLKFALRLLLNARRPGSEL